MVGSRTSETSDVDNNGIYHMKYDEEIFDNNTGSKLSKSPFEFGLDLQNYPPPKGIRISTKPPRTRPRKYPTKRGQLVYSTPKNPYDPGRAMQGPNSSILGLENHMYDLRGLLYSHFPRAGFFGNTDLNKTKDIYEGPLNYGLGMASFGGLSLAGIIGYILFARLAGACYSYQRRCGILQEKVKTEKIKKTKISISKKGKGKGKGQRCPKDCEGRHKGPSLRTTKAIDFGGEFIYRVDPDSTGFQGELRTDCDKILIDEYPDSETYQQIKEMDGVQKKAAKKAIKTSKKDIPKSDQSWKCVAKAALLVLTSLLILVIIIAICSLIMLWSCLHTLNEDHVKPNRKYLKRLIDVIEAVSKHTIGFADYTKNTMEGVEKDVNAEVNPYSDSGLSLVFHMAWKGAHSAKALAIHLVTDGVRQMHKEIKNLLVSIEILVKELKVYFDLCYWFNIFIQIFAGVGSGFYLCMILLCVCIINTTVNEKRRKIRCLSVLCFFVMIVWWIIAVIAIMAAKLLADTCKDPVKAVLSYLDTLKKKKNVDIDKKLVRHYMTCEGNNPYKTKALFAIDVFGIILSLFEAAFASFSTVMSYFPNALDLSKGQAVLDKTRYGQVVLRESVDAGCNHTVRLLRKIMAEACNSCLMGLTVLASVAPIIAILLIVIAIIPCKIRNPGMPYSKVTVQEYKERNNFRPENIARGRRDTHKQKKKEEIKRLRKSLQGAARATTRRGQPPAEKK